MKKTFSIFHANGGAGNVRGIQVAEYLGAKRNPESGYEDDICIYVKIIPPENFPKHSYLDVVDSARAIDFLKNHPSMGVIAISRVAQEYLMKVLKRNDVIFIPHHHCNYERFVRLDREVKTVGIIGSKTAFQYPVDKFRKELAKIGLDLLYDEDHWKHYNNDSNEEGKDSREKVVRFYKKIDVQVVYRPEWISTYEPLRSPLKLENAGSFSIPTVAYPEPSYMDEWKECFIPNVAITGLLKSVERLKIDPLFYRNMADISKRKAEEYHIKNVSKLYLNL